MKTNSLNHLLRTKWRSSGFHVITRHAVDGSFRDIWVSGIDDVECHLDRSANWYFAASEFERPSARSQYVVGAKHFCLDVDCGPEKVQAGTGYSDAVAAEAKFAEFLRKTGLPPPTDEVSSGVGRHFYWTLDRFVCAEEWKSWALILKALARANGFLADPAKTADVQGIFRLPGTLNHKYERARPVEIVHAARKPISADLFLPILARFSVN